MKRTRIPTRAILLRAILVGTLVICTTGCWRNMVERRASQIRPGQIKAEVENLLGKPTRTTTLSEIGASTPPSEFANADTFFDRSAFTSFRGLSNAALRLYSREGMSADNVARALAAQGLYCSSGDFYAATVCDVYAIDALLRVGCACYTTEDDVRRLIDAVGALSPRQESAQ